MTTPMTREKLATRLREAAYFCTEFAELQKHCAQIADDIGVLPDYAQVPSIDTDLVQRCQELLTWSKTGLLAGGEGGAIRALATQLEAQIGSHYSLSVAESQTKDDAMHEIVRLASSPSNQGASK